MKTRSLSLATSLFALAWSWEGACAQGVAPAASPPPAPPSASPPQQAVANGGGSSLEDIVVTAQRRAENLQNVPIAITALDQKQLAAAGVSDTFSLKAAVPGLNIANTSAYTLPQIRGIGTGGGGAGVENPVAVYIDGVYVVSASGALLRLNDVEQVAVLKGPQGTLFGRNATGGLLQITTRMPQQKFEANFSGTVANYATYGVDGFVTGGLTPDLAASVSASYNDQRHGFGRNLFNGKYVNDGDSVAARGHLLWTPGGATRILLSADYSRYHGARSAYALVKGAYAANLPGPPTPFNKIPHVGGYYDSYSSLQPNMKVEQGGANLNLQHDVGDTIRFVSITAYRKNTTRFGVDSDQGPSNFVNLLAYQRDRQLSQEVQLQSLGTGRFKWTVGAYYFDGLAFANPTVTGLALGLQLPPFPPFTAADALYDYGRQSTKSIAGFGQGTYEVFKDTNLTLGVRYTSEKRTMTQAQYLYGGGANLCPQVPPFVPVCIAPARFKQTFDRFTFRASVDHRFSPELLAYASFNSGFKSGFFNTASFDASDRLVRPEFLNAYEVGIKTDLLDHRLRFNAAAFYYDYTNIQAFYIVNSVARLANGKGATVYGLDADLTWRVTRALTLTGGTSLLHARYDSFPGAQGSFPTPVGGNAIAFPFNFDATGNQLQLAPKYTFNAGFNWRIPFLSSETGSGVTAAANYYYNDGFFADPQNRLRQKHYNTLDGSLTWATARDRLSIRGWVQNLTGAKYARSIISTASGDLYEAAPPRTYGVTAGVRF